MSICLTHQDCQPHPGKFKCSFLCTLGYTGMNRFGSMQVSLVLARAILAASMYCSAVANRCFRKRYAHSKMALMIHARAIHNRYHSEGISAFSLHTGIAATNLQSADPTLFGTLIRIMVRWHIMPGSISVADNARTTLFCATSPDAVKEQ